MPCCGNKLGHLGSGKRRNARTRRVVWRAVEDKIWRSRQGNFWFQPRWNRTTQAHFCCGRQLKSSGPNAKKQKLRTLKSKHKEIDCEGDSKLRKAPYMRMLPILLSYRFVLGVSPTCRAVQPWRYEQLKLCEKSAADQRKPAWESISCWPESMGWGHQENPGEGRAGKGDPLIVYLSFSKSWAWSGAGVHETDVKNHSKVYKNGNEMGSPLTEGDREFSVWAWLSWLPA